MGGKVFVWSSCEVYVGRVDSKQDLHVELSDHPHLQQVSHSVKFKNCHRFPFQDVNDYNE